MKHRKWIAFALSLTTIFGGHWINNRWDRIVLFVLLLYALPVILSNASMNGGPDFGWFFSSLPILLGGVCLLSAVIAYVDAVKPEEGMFSRITKAVTGSAMVLIGMVVIAGVWMSQASKPGGLITSAPEVVTKAADMAYAQGFLDSTGMSIGDYNYRSNKLLAAGAGRIVGHVMADGKPVKGFKLQLKFMPDLKSQWVESDANGRYEVHVPPGRYQYAGYEFDSLNADRLLGGMINNDDFSFQNMVINAREQGESKGVDFSFVTAVDVLAPILNESVKLDDVVFRWKPYPGAAFYRFSIDSFGKDGKTYRRESPLGEDRHWVDVKETSITPAMIRLPLNKGEYYRWSVTAYSAGEKELGSSPKTYRYTIFRVE